MSQISDKTNLFSPLKTKTWSLPNRIAMAPMTRSRADDNGVPTKMMIKYYQQRSDSLIITEATGISRQGLGWFKAPGIWNDKQVQEWKKITNAVHEKKGQIGIQLWHMGRQSHTFVTGQTHIFAPSPIPLQGEITTRPTDEDLKNGIYTNPLKKPYETPYPLLNDEDKNGHDEEYKDIKHKYYILDVIKDYGIAAKNALKAGFDFIEIHGANGYLIDEFLQSCSNKRNDKYGGNIENRLLFMKQVVNEVVKSFGNNKSKVGIRLSPNGAFGGMGSKDNNETFDAAIQWLTKNNIGFIHLMDGLGFGFHKLSEPYTLKRAMEIIKKNSKDTDSRPLLMGNVGYTKETANEQLLTGDVDLIAFGRPYIGNPDLVFRFKNNLKLNEKVDMQGWWGIHMGETGYIDFPLHESNKNNN